jgi:hypothetical protein
MQISIECFSYLAVQAFSLRERFVVTQCNQRKKPARSRVNARDNVLRLGQAFIIVALVETSADVERN